MLSEWVEGYVRAWESNDPDDIEALFTEDARYLTEPYAKPWSGRETIVRKWLEHRDEPGDATFSWEPLVETPEIGVLQGRTVYRDPPRSYANLWVIRFAGDGRCSEFTEWYMESPAGS